MCKEDIRIARAAAPGRAISIAGTVADQLVFGANSNRYSLSLAIMTNSVINSTGGMVIYSLVGGFKRPLIGVSYDTPSGNVNIQDVGNVLTGDIWLKTNDTVNLPTVAITESIFLSGLEDI